jgi:hypothetical protein
VAKESSGKINKSHEIRLMIDQYPHAQSKDIVSKLASKGIRVQPSLVYYIKSKQRNTKRRAKHQRVVEASRGMGSGNPVALILHVRTLAAEAGGIKNLKQLVDALAE